MGPRGRGAALKFAAKRVSQSGNPVRSCRVLKRRWHKVIRRRGAAECCGGNV